MATDYAIKFFTDDGQRLFLTPEEYDSFVSFLETDASEKLSICQVLAHTGCRIVEALALCPEDFDISGGAIYFGVNEKLGIRAVRSVPIPSQPLEILDLHYNIRERLKGKKTDEKLPCIWRFSRGTPYHRVNEAMKGAGIEGLQATPTGLRYGFALKHLTLGHSPKTVTYWMGQPPRTCIKYEQLLEETSVFNG